MPGVKVVKFNKYVKMVPCIKKMSVFSISLFKCVTSFQRLYSIFVTLVAVFLHDALVLCQ